MMIDSAEKAALPKMSFTIVIQQDQSARISHPPPRDKPTHFPYSSQGRCINYFMQPILGFSFSSSSSS
jgi:hypothetical protein